MSDQYRPITLSENDLKEIFSLLTSVTVHERDQIYELSSEFYFLNVDLSEEYSLTEEKREYALDAWRSVIYFLYSKGYKLQKNNEVIDLSFSDDEFIS